MHLTLLFLLTLPALLPAAAAQATLNKCVGAQGGITYSNLPCINAREMQRVEIDPPPQPDPPGPRSAVVPPPAKSATHPAPRPEPAVIRLDTRRVSGKPGARVPARQCSALSDKLGRVLDTMDQARRKGYTQAQIDAWNADIREIERQKQQSGCF